MGVSIKNPEAERLIRELAELTGEGQTEAVMHAVEEKILRVQAERGEGRIARMRAIADRMAPLFKPPYDTMDIDELLYDKETGLPK
jgi:antitoxin VapB